MKYNEFYMSEDPPNTNIPETEPPSPSVEAPQFYGPPSPDDRELAKNMRPEQVAYALFDKRSANRILVETTAERDKLKFDSQTGLLNRGPGEELAEKLIAEVMRASSEAPTSVMLLMIDVVNLHGINEVHGHRVGDAVISTAAQQLAEVAEILRSSLRTYDQRSSSTDSDREDHIKNEQRQADRRQDQYRDIIWRRGGDEFVAIVPFHESDTITKELVKEIVTKRIEHPKGYGAEDMVPIRWGSAFYNPKSNPDMTVKGVIEYLENEADPKGNGDSSRGSKAA